VGEHGLTFQAQESDVGRLSLALGQAGIGILALTPELATLEDLFFRLTEGGQDTLDLAASEPDGDGAPPGGRLGAAVSGLAATARALEESR
jgi:hypothetical protein